MKVPNGRTFLPYSTIVYAPVIAFWESLELMKDGDLQTNITALTLINLKYKV
eukprot:CAMPEP_0202973800 /NCGR_PEP_ID=MMETSP1396-20130829/54145_1 /ASSEMBLY_ACC=CAM_ASM_000872 /TAXON_ID= /ORGANISM="Pseudokeronopsis sp., Strain Brazil" /LENGTH=51 /DNA_ID=CAMNT_0049706507 /DNA_START=91 /DNA_END=242 /DNA_ORIENTATION=+